MTARDLVVIGAGGSSREIAESVRRLTAAGPRWRLAGFLDDDPALEGRTLDGLPVLGPLRLARENPGWSLVIGVAHPRYPDVRRRIAAALGLPAARFAALADATATIAGSARLRAGSVVLAHAVVSHEADVGEHVLVSALCSVSHGVRLDEGVTLAAGAIVSGSSRVGAGAYLGAGCVVRDGLTVGAGAVVGLGAVVVRDVPAGATVVGNPARPLPPRASAVSERDRREGAAATEGADRQEAVGGRTPAEDRRPLDAGSARP
ncbi:MAG TPA: NeuD/PglB/VioB family sugar acetyltransferase [Gemmatimonadota bacterium]